MIIPRVTKIIPITANEIAVVVWYVCRKPPATMKSKRSVSEEKRTSILPNGVVSKNSVGARITDSNNALWRIFEARMLPNVNEI